MKSFVEQLPIELASKKYNSLDNRELQSLLALAQRGHEKSKQLIIDSVSRFVYSKAGDAYQKNEPFGTIDFEDYYQAGLIAVLNAIRDFKPNVTGYKSRTKTFLSYIRDKVEGAMKDHHKLYRVTVKVEPGRQNYKNDDLEIQAEKRAQANIFVNRMTQTNEYDTFSSYSWLESDTLTPSQSLDRKDARDTIINCIENTSKLTEMQKLGVYATFRGLNEEMLSLDYFANSFGISHEMARKHGLKGLEKIKKYNSEVLKDLLEIYN